jgi:hypothetical protein
MPIMPGIAPNLETMPARKNKSRQLEVQQCKVSAGLLLLAALGMASQGP